MKVCPSILFLFAFALQAFLFSSNESSSCGSGVLEFHRFNAYNANDSLISVIIINSNGDTIDLTHYEYDSNGKLSREIEISGLLTRALIFQHAAA